MTARPKQDHVSAGAPPETMRIASFNINGINTRLPNLLRWLDAFRPDAVCLQELKAEHGYFPEAALRDAGYGAVWCGERRWNGVAILARGAVPVLTRRRLPGDPADTQARYVEAAVGGVLLCSLYLPNGNPRPGPKFEYKLRWFDRLLAHAAALLAENVPVILAGDFNVVPTEEDIFAGHRERENALLRPETRDRFRQLLEQGWTDGLRHLHPQGPLWTFWAYLHQRWPADKGMRLDHLLLSPTLLQRLRGGDECRDVRGETGASDHAPAFVALDRVPRPNRTTPAA